MRSPHSAAQIIGHIFGLLSEVLVVASPVAARGAWTRAEAAVLAKPAKVHEIMRAKKAGEITAEEARKRMEALGRDRYGAD